LSDLMASLLIAATIKLVFSYNGLCRACVCVRGGGEGGREGGREGGGELFWMVIL
jgi:hypothetical protein